MSMSSVFRETCGVGWHTIISLCFVFAVLAWVHCQELLRQTFFSFFLFSFFFSFVLTFLSFLWRLHGEKYLDCTLFLEHTSNSFLASSTAEILDKKTAGLQFAEPLHRNFLHLQGMPCQVSVLINVARLYNEHGGLQIQDKKKLSTLPFWKPGAIKQRVYDT